MKLCNLIIYNSKLLLEDGSDKLLVDWTIKFSLSEWSENITEQIHFL